MQPLRLPRKVGYPDFRELHRQPLTPWLPALETIRLRHALPPGDWRRAPQGRNAVFVLASSHVVKLVPPFWREQADREEAALRLVAGRLPVRTPTTVASGELDGWRYLVLAYLEGRVLGWNWEALTPDERVAIADQSGVLAARLHGLELPDDSATALRFDWPALLTRQRDAAAGDFAEGGLAAALIDTFPDYLDAAGDLAAAPHVLLQGDLSAVNLIVEGTGTAMTVTGLLDFGDAKLGPFEHEFISPVMHFFCGETAVLEAFYRGYGLTARDRSARLEQRLMARSALYYAELLEDYRLRLPEPPEPTWPRLAHGFWRMSAE